MASGLHFLGARLIGVKVGEHVGGRHAADPADGARLRGAGREHAGEIGALVVGVGIGAEVRREAGGGAGHEGDLGIVLGGVERRVAERERVGENQVVAALGEIAQQALGIGVGDVLDIGDFGAERLAGGLEAVIADRVPVIVGDRAGQDHRDLEAGSQCRKRQRKQRRYKSHQHCQWLEPPPQRQARFVLMDHSNAPVGIFRVIGARSLGAMRAAATMIEQPGSRSMPIL